MKPKTTGRLSQKANNLILQAALKAPLSDRRPQRQPGPTINVEIRESVRHYDPVELEVWRAGVKHEFPNDPRLAHFTYKQPSYYFGETWVCRDLMQQGYICWSDRFQLFKAVGPESPFYLYTREIGALLGKQIMTALTSMSARVDFKLKAPDVAAYDPINKYWKFYEVKLPGDSLKPAQLQSLAILQNECRAWVGVVRLVPEGKTVKPRTHRVTVTMH